LLVAGLRLRLTLGISPDEPVLLDDDAAWYKRRVRGDAVDPVGPVDWL